MSTSSPYARLFPQTYYCCLTNTQLHNFICLSMSFIRYSYSKCRARECCHIISKLRKKKDALVDLVAFLLCGVCMVYIEHLSPLFDFHICASSLLKKCHYALTFSVFVFGDAASLFALDDAMCFVMDAFSLAWSEIDSQYFPVGKTQYFHFCRWIQLRLDSIAASKSLRFRQPA